MTGRKDSYQSIKRFLWLGFIVLLMPATVKNYLSGQESPSWFDEELVASAPTTIDDYKTIHRNPELGKAEFKTAAFVRKRLEAIGYTKFVPEPTLPTAVIAILDTGRPGPTVVLRSELDARPGKESAPVDYPSTVPDTMHSCGHDAHTATLISAASILFRHRGDFKGKFVFLFQPAEETPGGADDIVRDKILQSLGADYMFAQHVAPGLVVGTIQIAPGPIMASSTYFTVKVHGAGGHAAGPQDTSDIVRTASELVTDLTTYPARHLDVVARPTVISVARFESDAKALNKLPEDATFEGTLRSFEDIPATGHAANGLLTQIDEFMAAKAKAEHASVQIDWRNGSPVAVNDAKLYGMVEPVLAANWKGTLLTADQRSMYSEDFAFYSAVLPTLYFSLGVAGESHGHHPVHSDEFDIDLGALKPGVRLLLELAQIGSSLPRR